MTSPLPTSSQSSVLSPQHWIELDAAARLTGMSERHLRRLCGEEWLSQGKARTARGEGTKPRWQIRADAHPLLAAQPTVQPATAPGADEFRSLPQSARAKAQGRALLLAEWNRFVAAYPGDREKATAMFLAALPEERRVSRATLYNWHAAWKRDGLVGLADGRAAPADRKGYPGEDPFLAEVLAIWKDKALKIQACYDIAVHTAQKNAWKICSYRTAHRFIETWKKANPAQAILARQGHAAFQNTVAPYITRDYSTLESNELWTADHHVFDVMVKCGVSIDRATGEESPIYKRPWLTAVQDVRSRKIVGWLIREESPDTEAIRIALFRGFKTHHIPAIILTDNGKDFDCQVFTGQTKAMRWQRRRVAFSHDQRLLGGIFAGMQIEHLHAWPFHGQSKPVERFFGTACERFSKSFDTYTGRNAQDRPEKLVGPPGHPEQGALGRGLGPTLEEFIQQFGDWLEADYHGRTHTGDAMDVTPAHAWQANLHTIRTMPEEELEIRVLPRVGPVAVTQNGVRWQTLQYGAGEINHLFGRKVYLRLDDDVRTVSLWDEQDRPLGTASLNRKLPFLTDRQQLKEVLAQQRADTRALKGAQEARLRIHLDTTDRLINAAAEQARRTAEAAPPTDPTTPSPNYKSVGTGLKPASNPAQLPFKKAVGDGVAEQIDRFDLASAMENLSLAPAPESRPGAGWVPSLTDLVSDD